MKRRQLTIFARFLAAGLACFFLAQCGKSKSQKVTFSVVPSQPVAITGDVTVNGATITSPWFRFQLNIDNGADDSVVIVALSIKVTAPTFGNAMHTASVVPSGFNYTATDGSVTCNYSNFDTIAQGYSGPLTLTPDGTSIGCNIGAASPIFYVGSNPKPLDDSTPSSYRYRVEVTPQGWFGSPTEQRDRFSRTFTFYTQ